MVTESNAFTNSVKVYHNFIRELSNSKSPLDDIRKLQMEYDDNSNYYGKDFSFKDFYGKETAIVYVGCSKDFLNELKSKGVLFPKHGVSRFNGRDSSYEMMSNYLGWGGVFFGWIIPKEDFDYSDTPTDCVLLTLEIPIKFLVPHGYYEWCDLIYCLIDSETIEVADEISQEEFNMSLSEKVVSTFYPNFDNPGVEVFIKMLKKDWIVEKRYINSILI